jgi:hypothetical protein
MARISGSSKQIPEADSRLENDYIFLESLNMRKTVVILGVAAAAILLFSLASGSRTHAQTAYDATALKGAYGFTEQGGVGTTNPLVGLGLITADGVGGVSGYENVQIYGVGTQTRSFQGSYTVNSDGTGSMTLVYAASAPAPDASGDVTSDSSQLTSTYNFVIVNNKLEMRGVRSENGVLVTSDFTRQ